MLLQLLQLREDLPPHRLRDNRTDRLIDPVQLNPQLEDFGARVRPSSRQGLKFTPRGSQAGLHTDLDVDVDQGRKAF